MGKMEGKRPKGCLRKRQEDAVAEDAREMLRAKAPPRSVTPQEDELYIQADTTRVKQDSFN